MHTSKLLTHIELTAPLRFAAPWDLSGIQIASHKTTVQTLAVALDPTPEIVRAALDANADVLLCHHPLALKPRLPAKPDAYHQILSLALQADLLLYSAHTSLDANPQGPVNWLGKALALQNCHVLEPTFRETPVLTRTRPLTNPQSEDFTELLIWPGERTELLQHSKILLEIPVKSPAKIYGFGCIGALPEPCTWNTFQKQLQQLIPGQPRLIGSPPKSIGTVAYCGGSGASLAEAAFSAGADIFLTGDFKFHQAQESAQHGCALDIGHFSLEEGMMLKWSHLLRKELPELHVVFIPGTDPFS